MLADPAVESISSFIGVDGTNLTLNTGRFLVNLKPHSDRDSADVVMRRLLERVAEVEGITLYLQPVQDLTIEDRVSRTQYQFTLEAPTAGGDGACLAQGGADVGPRPRQSGSSNSAATGCLLHRVCTGVMNVV